VTDSDPQGLVSVYREARTLVVRYDAGDGDVSLLVHAIDRLRSAVIDDRPATGPMSIAVRLLLGTALVRWAIARDDETTRNDAELVLQECLANAAPASPPLGERYTAALRERTRLSEETGSPDDTAALLIELSRDRRHGDLAYPGTAVCAYLARYLTSCRQADLDALTGGLARAAAVVPGGEPIGDHAVAEPRTDQPRDPLHLTNRVTELLRSLRDVGGDASAPDLSEPQRAPDPWYDAERGPEQAQREDARYAQEWRPAESPRETAAPSVAVEEPPPPAPAAQLGETPLERRRPRRVRALPRRRSKPPSRTRKVHARLDTPREVAAGSEFTLTVGIAAAPPTGARERAPMQVPVGEFRLTVALMTDGFTRADGGSGWELTMIGSSQQPYPAMALELVALDDPELQRSRAITAVYDIGGHTIGVATAVIDVLPAAEAPAASRLDSTALPPRPEAWAVPTEGEPDLVITVSSGSDKAGRRLLWHVTSPHAAVRAPAGPVTTVLPHDTGEWARRVMRDVEERRHDPRLPYYLRHVSKTVGERIPEEIWAALHDSARVCEHPAVLLATAEPFIPWELAQVPCPWDRQRPDLLGAQAQLGRWIYPEPGDIPAPTATIEVTRMAVVKGVYGGTSRLKEAEAEADELVTKYRARPVPAQAQAVLACIEGEPEADVLHLAVHGRLGVAGVQDGIILDDRYRPLGPGDIGGARTCRPRLVFLNACQVGQGQEMLGEVAGVVPSFITARAQAVIAPLWKIDDAAARQFAERFYVGLCAGRPVAELLAEERTRALGSTGAPELSVLGYVFFGHPRLTATTGGDIRNALAGA
jgi:hypothetical protein